MGGTLSEASSLSKPTGGGNFPPFGMPGGFLGANDRSNEDKPQGKSGKSPVPDSFGKSPPPKKRDRKNNNMDPPLPRKHATSTPESSSSSAPTDSSQSSSTPDTQAANFTNNGGFDTGPGGKQQNKGGKGKQQNKGGGSKGGFNMGNIIKAGNVPRSAVAGDKINTTHQEIDLGYGEIVMNKQNQDAVAKSAISPSTLAAQLRAGPSAKPGNTPPTNLSTTNLPGGQAGKVPTGLFNPGGGQQAGNQNANQPPVPKLQAPSVITQGGMNQMPNPMQAVGLPGQLPFDPAAMQQMAAQAARAAQMQMQMNADAAAQGGDAKRFSRQLSGVGAAKNMDGDKGGNKGKGKGGKPGRGGDDSPALGLDPAKKDLRIQRMNSMGKGRGRGFSDPSPSPEVSGNSQHGRGRRDSKDQSPSLLGLKNRGNLTPGGSEQKTGFPSIPGMQPNMPMGGMPPNMGNMQGMNNMQMQQAGMVPPNSGNMQNQGMQNQGNNMQSQGSMQQNQGNMQNQQQLSGSPAPTPPGQPPAPGSGGGMAPPLPKAPPPPNVDASGNTPTKMDQPQGQGAPGAPPPPPGGGAPPPPPPGGAGGLTLPQLPVGGNASRQMSVASSASPLNQMGNPMMQAPNQLPVVTPKNAGMAPLGGQQMNQQGQMMQNPNMQLVQLPNGTMAMQQVPNQMNNQQQMPNQMGNQPNMMGNNQMQGNQPGMQRQPSPQPTMIQGPNGQMMPMAGTLIQGAPGQMIQTAPGTTVINNTGQQMQGNMQQPGQMQNVQGMQPMQQGNIQQMPNQMQGSPQPNMQGQPMNQPGQVQNQSGMQPVNQSGIQPMNQSGMQNQQGMQPNQQQQQQGMQPNQMQNQQQQGMQQQAGMPQFQSVGIPQFASVHAEVLKDGDAIELCNLVKQPALNGTAGVVVSAELEVKGQKFVAVRLATDKPDAAPKRLKPENVRKPFKQNEQVELCELTQDTSLNGAPAIILNLNYVDPQHPNEKWIQVNTPAGVKIVKPTNIRKNAPPQPQVMNNSNAMSAAMFGSNAQPMMMSNGQVMFASNG